MNKSVYVIATLALNGKALVRRKFYAGNGKLAETGAEARHYTTAKEASERINYPGAVLNKQYRNLSGYTLGVVELRPRFETVRVINEADIARSVALSKLNANDRMALGIKA